MNAIKIFFSVLVMTVLFFVGVFLAILEFFFSILGVLVIIALIIFGIGVIGFAAIHSLGISL